MENFPLGNLILLIFSSYLIGSIPTAYIIAKVNKIDIFQVGSGNMGATNVSRAIGIPAGALVWLIDSCKGILAIMLGRALITSEPAFGMALAAVLAIAGHNWSLFVLLLIGSIRGGKGAATAFGTLLMIAPTPVVAVSFFLCSAAVVITRHISLGVLVLFGFSLPWVLVLVAQNQLPMSYSLYSVVTAMLILYRFRENIYRLANGTERRLGDRA
ncbi:MAG: glycerol-3-phosphate acyltransferase [Chloroflexi bacterium]|nr:glycerol-3-phosphate acyltransferase [Chloroflexota bacterium]